MNDKENIINPSIRILIKELQNDRKSVESHVQKIVDNRKILEDSISGEETNLSALSNKVHKLNALNAVLGFKTDKVEKEASDLEEKNKFLREAIESLQRKITMNKEKQALELEQFQSEVLNLCELFGSAIFTYNENSTENEIKKIYSAIEEKQHQYEETKALLNASQMELDDIVLYQAPQSKQELEFPLAQRKIILNIFEDAVMKAEQRLNNLKNVQAEKEAKLSQLC